MPGKRKRTTQIKRQSKRARIARSVRPAYSRYDTSAVRSRLSRSRTSGANNEHSFKRWSSRVVNTITATDQTYSRSFTFSDIINNTEFDALYDRYMITKIVMEIQLVNPANGLIANSNVNSKSNFYPRMWYVRDYDDSTAETLDELKQRSVAKSFVLTPNKIFKIALRPAILAQTYRTALTTGYAPKWNQWVDMAMKDVPHYGLKWVMDTHNLNPDDADFFQYDTTFCFYFKCKDVR